MLCNTMKHREESEQTGSAKLELAYYIYFIHFVVISGGSSLPGPVPLAKFFKAAKGVTKSSS